MEVLPKPDQGTMRRSPTDGSRQDFELVKAVMTILLRCLLGVNEARNIFGEATRLVCIM